MERDEERIGRLAAALERAKLDALCCHLPHNVLLLTGYWPVFGNALAVFTRDGEVALIVHEDEQELARAGWVPESLLLPFRPFTLARLGDGNEAIRPLLSEAGRQLRLARAAIGYEGVPGPAHAPRAALHVGDDTLQTLYRAALPDADFWDASALIAEQRATLTDRELRALRPACQIAAEGFAAAARAIRPGATEAEVAAAARLPLENGGQDAGPVRRAGGHAVCLSGSRSADAYRAHTLVGNRQLAAGDLVLVQIHAYADGYWTDLARTYVLGEPSSRQLAMYEAVLDARSLALRAIRAGVPARAIDAAAREHLASAGFPESFKHHLGHGVGFAALDEYHPPRLHPCSKDIVQRGMVFSVEPALYVAGPGGLRHGDMVLALEDGPRLLSSFHASLDDLLLAA